MIETARLILRRPHVDDAADLHAIMSDPQAMRYWSTLPHATMDETRAYLTRMIGAGDVPDYVVCEKSAPGRVIGKAGCWNETGEVGMLFAPSVWGRGYAAEALRAAMPQAFAADPKLEKLLADVDPRNGASVRVLEKLGFTVTGHAPNTYCIGGEWSDSVYLALPRSSLAANSNAQG